MIQKFLSAIFMARAHWANNKATPSVRNPKPMALLRYSLAGSIATLAHYIALVIAVESSTLPPALAALLGATTGAMIGYEINRRYTFKSRHPRHRTMARFALVALIGAAISTFVVWAGASLGIHYLAAQAVASLLTLGMTFLINSTWTFS